MNKLRVLTLTGVLCLSMGTTKPIIDSVVTGAIQGVIASLAPVAAEAISNRRFNNYTHRLARVAAAGIWLLLNKDRGLADLVSPSFLIKNATMFAIAYYLDLRRVDGVDGQPHWQVAWRG